ncbi:serine hydrolase domain-containing protein [Krasilnikovia sp. M28-CT-15]|uniref:serine hydrolase domain-containing protein n=1 Tax=Krasilnikovia sp. M28-CT-15 TaxID=3373540 RepID=UPI0038777527
MSDICSHTQLSLSLDAAHWQQRLETLAAEHGVSGAVLGIAHGDDIAEAAWGVTNMRSGDAVHTDTVFQIGSITKVYTATAVMRLVAEGLLDLDKPISAWLPTLRLADDAASRITLGHLLTHTSGIPGDLFTDTGRGDDCLERFADSLASVPQLLPPGLGFSYCNTGFSLVGRVIEQVTGRVWDQAMRELLFTPLGLDTTMTLPEEALLHSAATGHERGPDGTLAPVTRWGLPRSNGPAGGIICTARDVLTFARFHLSGGQGTDGTSVLSSGLIQDMQNSQIQLPFRDAENESMGLTWFRHTWDGHALIGHDGGTIGQTALLRLLPSHNLAVVLLTNGGPARDLYYSLYNEIFTELAGISMPPALKPPAGPAEFDVERHAGTYGGIDAQHEVLLRGSLPCLRWAVVGGLTDVMPSTGGEYETVAAERDVLLYREPGFHRWVPATFVQLPDGRPYLYAGLRAYPRAA